MKKILFIISVLLNLFLFIICIYQLSRPKIFRKDNSYITYFSLQNKIAVNNGDIVFMGGDQVVQCNWAEFFENCKIKNRGIPGARINNEIGRMDKLLENSPSQIFLLFGIDDLNGGSSPEVVFEQYRNMVRLIQQKSPMTEIVIQSVFPVNANLKALGMSVDQNEIETLNSYLKNFSLENGIIYLNFYEDFQNEEGGLNSYYTIGDGFHLNASGYLVWKDRIKSFVR